MQKEKSYNDDSKKLSLINCNMSFDAFTEILHNSNDTRVNSHFHTHTDPYNKKNDNYNIAKSTEKLHKLTCYSDNVVN